jgi:NAD(P)H-flavin reductase
VDEKGGPISKVLNYARPGSVLHMCGMGGLRLKFNDHGIFFKGRQIKRIGLIAGGTGIAPMVQIMRAYTDHVRKNKVAPNGLHLLYAAEEKSDLAYITLLEKIRDGYPEHFRYYLKLNRPPLGWTEGVGFANVRDVQAHLLYPPREGDFFVMCGPPVFERAMIKTLQRLGFNSSQWFSYAEGDNVSATV